MEGEEEVSNDKYIVTTYEAIQVAPCLGSGLRAVFGERDGARWTAPVAAMVICRVRSAWYRNGRFLSLEGRVERQLCGALTWSEEGFGICEECSNFLGYLQPGEELEEKNAGTPSLVSTDQGPRK